MQPFVKALPVFSATVDQLFESIITFSFSSTGFVNPRNCRHSLLIINRVAFVAHNI